MERASKVIGNLGIPAEALSREAVACAAWAGAVGRRIASHTRAARMVRTHLIVEVEDAIWQRQLFALGEQVRRKIDENIGPGIVEEIEFRIVPPRLGPRRAQHSAAQADEAEAIADPVLRNIYKASRKR